MHDDMVWLVKRVHKKAVRTLEELIEETDTTFTTSEIEKVHHLLEIIKDGEKMKALYKEEHEAEE